MFFNFFSSFNVEVNVFFYLSSTMKVKQQYNMLFPRPNMYLCNYMHSQIYHTCVVFFINSKYAWIYISFLCSFLFSDMEITLLFIFIISSVATLHIISLGFILRYIIVLSVKNLFNTIGINDLFSWYFLICLSQFICVQFVYFLIV